MKKSNKIISSVALAVLALFFYGLVTAGEFYKVKKADGSIEYTQTPPSQSSEPVNLPGLSVISPEKKITRYNPEKSAVSTDDKEPKRDYSSLKISSPVDEESIWGADTNVTVQVEFSGSLIGGDKVQIYLNGKAQSPLVGSTLTLSELDRGEHTLQAKITNSRGKVMASSPTVRFFMKPPQTANLNRVQPRGN